MIVSALAVAKLCWGSSICYTLFHGICVASVEMTEKGGLSVVECYDMIN